MISREPEKTMPRARPTRTVAQRTWWVLTGAVALLPSVAAGQQRADEPRPPAVAVAPSYDLSVGVVWRSWEDSRVEEGAGPTLLLRRDLVGPLRARFGLTTQRADINLGAAPVPGRMYGGRVGVDVAPLLSVGEAARLRPSVHASIGTLVTVPDQDDLLNRSQNQWGLGAGLDLLAAERWLVGAEYRRVWVRLEDPSGDGLQEGVRTGVNEFVIAVGFRF